MSFRVDHHTGLSKPSNRKIVFRQWTIDQLRVLANKEQIRREKHQGKIDALENKIKGLEEKRDALTSDRKERYRTDYPSMLRRAEQYGAIGVRIESDETGRGFDNYTVYVLPEGKVIRRFSFEHPDEPIIEDD